MAIIIFYAALKVDILGDIIPSKGKKKEKGKLSLRAGFEPAREDPIGFQVQRLNHSAITARDGLGEKFNYLNLHLKILVPIS